MNISLLKKTIYGGTSNLLAHTFTQYGITTTFVDAHNLQEVEDAIQENTKAIYIETPTNPMMNVTDIAALVEIAKRHNLLLIVDNTFFISILPESTGTGSGHCSAQRNQIPGRTQ